MAKDDHWFKFFYRLIMMSCQGWKDDEFGAYVKLLIHQFDKGGLPSSEIELSKLITTYKKNWPLISGKFKKGEDGLLRNDFMQNVREERDEKSRRGTEFGKTGGRGNKKGEPLENKGYPLKKETHIDHYPSPSSVSFGDGDCLKGEEVTLPQYGFFSDSLEPTQELPEHDAGKTIEFIRLKHRKILNYAEIRDQWEAFKIQQLTVHKWYNDFGDFVTHFRNALNLEIKNNGTGFNRTGDTGNNPKPAGGKQAGAKQLADQLRTEIQSLGPG